ncbi:hypothetical protein GQ54DRAFT_305264 [Martensiomyces pterosporus]|nr:hypothetical protein GQ54DRAFT_305264 [Martensiomyces pterosporus]
MTSRATDPLNDINSPVSLQYLQFAMNSPLFLNDPVTTAANLGAYIGSPHATSAAATAAAATIAAPAAANVGVPKRQQQQMVAGTSFPTASSGVLTAAMPTSAVPVITHTHSAKGLSVSPMMTDTLPGFVHPAEVFTTPETRPLPDPQTQPTPDLLMFDDSVTMETPRERAITNDINALSPRTQTAQTGLSLLAASATYARGTNSDIFARPQNIVSAPSAESQATVAIGSPFLTSNGEDATLMSQPQNSLAQHLSSPPMTDRGIVPGIVGSGTAVGMSATSAAVAALAAGRMARSRSLLRNSSALTSASFHNDLVPQATESFFAPLDEVCSDSEPQALGLSQQNGYSANPSQPEVPPSAAAKEAVASVTACLAHHTSAARGPPSSAAVTALPGVYYSGSSFADTAGS